MGLIKRMSSIPAEGFSTQGSQGSLELTLAGWTPDEIKFEDRILDVVLKILDKNSAYPLLLDRLNEVMEKNKSLWDDIESTNPSAVFSFIISMSAPGNTAYELRTLILAEARKS